MTNNPKFDANQLNQAQAINQVDEIISEDEKRAAEEYYYIVETVASIIASRKKLPPSIDYNDLLSAGFDGLIKAMRKFTKDKDTEFKTYANIRVREI